MQGLNVEKLYVALRKESVDRNCCGQTIADACNHVALRKESVDRNIPAQRLQQHVQRSLSARRAWIEMYSINEVWANFSGRSPQGERG